jgi:hypothetical protein
MTRAAFEVMAGLSLALVFSGCGGTSGAPATPAPTPGVAYQVANPAGFDLWFAPTDGSGPPVALGDSPDEEYFSRASGDRVLYRRSSPTGTYHVYSVRRDGTGRIGLGIGVFSEGLYGVVEGRAIILQSGDGSTVTSKVISVTLDGATTITLAEAPSTNPGTVAVRVLEGRIFTTTSANSDFSGAGVLATIKADGTGRTVLLDQPAVADVSSGGKVVARSRDTSTGTVRDHLFVASLDGSGRQDLGILTLSTGGTQVNGLRSQMSLFESAGRAYFSTYDQGTSTGTMFAIPLATGVIETMASASGSWLVPWAVGNGRVIANRMGATEYLATIDGASHTVTDFPNYRYNTYFAGTAQGKVLYTQQRSADWRDIDLVSANADGSNLTALATTPLTEAGFGGGLGDDSARVALGVGDRVVFRKSVGGQDELCSCLIDGSSQKVISQGAGAKGLERVVGNVVIYRSVNGGSGDLFAVNADGTNHVALTTAPENESFFEMVGQTVVFKRLSAAGAVSLHTVPLGGGTPKLLVTSPVELYPAAGI